jgi:oligoendopeptidase F
VDAFQHWVYENPTSAGDPAQCDGVWEKLWERFMPGVDWEGFADARATGWQRKLHIHTYPFYYVEYGLALLGAFQIWARALIDPAGALSNYRRALALGGTVSLPKLYQAAGARLAFDSGILYETIALIEDQVEKLETAI